jgi:hypothetical protein
MTQEREQLCQRDKLDFKDEKMSKEFLRQDEIPSFSCCSTSSSKKGKLENKSNQLTKYI